MTITYYNISAGEFVTIKIEDMEYEKMTQAFLENEYFFRKHHINCPTDLIIAVLNRQ